MGRRRSCAGWDCPIRPHLFSSGCRWTDTGIRQSFAAAERETRWQKREKRAKAWPEMAVRLALAVWLALAVRLVLAVWLALAAWLALTV